MDEPTALPDGTVLELVPLDADDGLDEDERRRRDAAIERGFDEVEAGEALPAEEVLAELGIKSSL